jgi:ribosomal-protein-alanine N-acetyltransferase
VTPAALATLHATAFEGAARWSAKSFEDMRDNPSAFMVERPMAFLVGRVIAGEAELLTLVVERGQRGQGIGRALMAEFDTEARRRAATQAFLEVAADNAPARALYISCGWIEVGHRVGYYQGVDAHILRKHL